MTTAEGKNQYTAKKGTRKVRVAKKNELEMIQCQQNFSPGRETSDGAMEQSVLTPLLMH